MRASTITKFPITKNFYLLLQDIMRYNLNIYISNIYYEIYIWYMISSCQRAPSATLGSKQNLFCFYYLNWFRNHESNTLTGSSVPKIQQQLSFSFICKTKFKCGKQGEKRENYMKLVNVLWEQFLLLSTARAGKWREETLWGDLLLNPRRKRGLLFTIPYSQNRLIPFLRGYRPSCFQFFSHVPQINTKRKAPFPLPSNSQKEAVSSIWRCVLQRVHKLQGAGGPSWGWRRAELLILFQHEIDEWFLPKSLNSFTPPSVFLFLATFSIASVFFQHLHIELQASDILCPTHGLA